MNKDAGQKDMLYRHFRCQGWYALLEVPVFYGRGYEHKPKLVTDVDVLGVRPSGDLSWEFVIGDCKTKKNESPANRVLWVRGLMEQVKAARAFVLLKQDGGIERDHMLFADSHRVTLIEEAGLETFDRCVIHPTGSKGFPEPSDALKYIREEVPRQYLTLAPLADFINRDAWNEGDLITMMRKSLGIGRAVRREVNPAKANQLAFIVEAASVFAVGLASCVGTIFHQYLLTNDGSALDDGLKVLIWGGRENYEHIAGLRKQLLEAKNIQADDGGLALPEWPAFLQLVRSFLAAPKLAFRAPQLLRSIAIDLVVKQEPLTFYGNRDLMLLKLAMNTALYYVNACGFPPDAATQIKAIFHKRMGDVALSSQVPLPQVVREAEGPPYSASAPRTTAPTVPPLTVGAHPDPAGSPPLLVPTAPVLTDSALKAPKKGGGKNRSASKTGGTENQQSLVPTDTND
ncbi:MAG: hypothetical protein IPO67_31845 [Deltaproteobacteria bacterium]|nr:hypothetical protein [Deltaproteobacteria bacterium]